MITSTGSNFGVTGIQIKDYQTEDMAILEAVFEVDPSNADYQACDVMEIYVPSLRFKKSLESTGFIVYEAETDPRYPHESRNASTVVKVWIKDENTICIEKIGIYDDLEAFKIFICSLFIPSGKRVPFQKHTKTTLTCTSEAVYMRSGYTFAVIEDDWMFLVSPPGEISNSAISIVSELLVLAGAILGVKTSYDAKFIKIESDLQRKADKLENNE